MSTFAEWSWRKGMVQDFCGRLRQSRDVDVMTAREWASGLYLAAAADVQAHADYDPEEDRRIWWARQVLAAMRAGKPRPRATGELEATVEWLLGEIPQICGKMRAANHN